MMPVVMTVMTVVKITTVLKSVSIIMEFRLEIDSRLSRNVDTDFRTIVIFTTVITVITTGIMCHYY